MRKSISLETITGTISAPFLYLIKTAENAKIDDTLQIMRDTKKRHFKKGHDFCFLDVDISQLEKYSRKAHAGDILTIMQRKYETYSQQQIDVILQIYSGKAYSQLELMEEIYGDFHLF